MLGASLLLQPAYAPPLFTSSSLFVVGRAGRQRSALETDTRLRDLALTEYVHLGLAFDSRRRQGLSA